MQCTTFPHGLQEKVSFLQKNAGKALTPPRQNPAARKKAPASPEGMPVRELRCQLVSVGGAGGSSGGMGS
ncbi:hypothetical protein MM50RIKEN_22790 [Vescimonas coprocola]|uniref:Uncharacterized protein n=1 Tax=Vescimonas coprocola TaxID=2714355 RepID=A0A810Q9Z3_9FIRM|nr:hypothetical protein MM50RIKEN_22790 [Vescimonas coprocola]